MSRPLRARTLALWTIVAALSSPACGSSSGGAVAAPPSGMVRAQCQKGESVLACGKNLDIAHRGGSLLAPEETLPAFNNAVQVGADVLELDVHATSDGVVVCMHDETVDRTTDGKGKIRETTFEALRKLDAGHTFTPDGGATFPYRGLGVVVPTLREVLEAFPDKPFSVEIKQSAPSIIDAVLAVLDQANAASRVVIASFDDDVLVALRKKRPEILTSFGTVEMIVFQKLAREEEATYKAPAKIIQAPKGVTSAEYLERARRLDLRVQVWTVNDRAEMDSLLALGVDGIISDDPKMLRAAILASASK